jgi:mycothiol synthase
VQSTAEQRKTFNFTIRRLTDEEIPEFVDFWNEIDRLEALDDGISLGEFKEWHNSPANDESYMIARLGTDGEPPGRIIGLSNFEMRHGDNRAWGWLHVHPNYRLAGVGTGLYNDFVRRAEEAHATIMYVGSNAKCNLLVEFLERRGHTLDRYFWTMRLPAEQAVDEPSLPEGFTVRTFVPGQDEALFAEVRNGSFADHFGSVRRTVEEMAYRTRQEQFRPDGLFFAFHDGEIAGYCYTEIDPRECERLGISVGNVHQLGVMPAYRRHGLGRALLLIGVKYLRQYVSIVQLGVEGKNNKALPLYESEGFYKYHGWANMAKQLAEAEQDEGPE